MSFLIALILIIWFRTDAVVEYGSLIRLHKFLKIDLYKEKKMEAEYALTYPRFLCMTYDNFFIKLITCPICISVWLSIIFCFFAGCLSIFPFICIFSLMMYGVTSVILGKIQ